MNHVNDEYDMIIICDIMKYIYNIAFAILNMWLEMNIILINTELYSLHLIRTTYMHET